MDMAKKPIGWPVLTSVFTMLLSEPVYIMNMNVGPI